MSRDGWWNRFVGPAADGGPAPPIVPASPTVPATAVAVGSVAGQQDKVAAIAFEIAEASRLTRAALVLKEADASGANSSAAQATVYACPITPFWPDGQRNGRWVDRPSADCATRSNGTRASDGSWRFDLTAMRNRWQDASAQQGVLLSVDPSSGPGAFQVSFVDVRSGGARVEAVLAPAPDAPIAPPGGELVVSPVTVSDAPISLVPVPVPADVAPPAPAPEIILARPAVGTSVAGGRNQGKVLGNIPGAGLLVVPLVVGLGLLVSFVLGPAGDPATQTSRHGSVSATLARRARRASQ
jgi:hypothetical protein